MKYNREQREITKAFKRVLTSPDGEVVMDYLMQEYGLAPISEENSIKMACGVGARNVVMHIVDILEREDNDDE